MTAVTTVHCPMFRGRHLCQFSGKEAMRGAGFSQTGPPDTVAQIMERGYPIEAVSERCGLSLKIRQLMRYSFSTRTGTHSR